MIVSVSEDYSERQVTKYFNFVYSSRIWVCVYNLHLDFLSLIIIILSKRSCLIIYSYLQDNESKKSKVMFLTRIVSDDFECQFVDRRDWINEVLKISVKKFVVTSRTIRRTKLLSVLSWHDIFWSVPNTTDNEKVGRLFVMSKSRVFLLFKCDNFFFRKRAGGISRTWGKLFLRLIEELVNAVKV